MFDHIETTTETVTTRSLTLVLSEGEVNAILVDPRKFQKALRAQRNTWYDHSPKWSATGHSADHVTGNSRRPVATKDAEKKSRRTAAKPKSAAQKCPHCGESFKRLARHLPACPNRDDLATFDVNAE